MEIRFRVWCEFEIKSEKHCSMESEASWYLLSQTGQLWSYGPLDPPSPLGAEYSKAIPLFYTGLKDKHGKEIFEGDILTCDATSTKGPYRYEVWWSKENACWCLGPPCTLTTNNWSDLVIVGNIYENPDLLKEEADNDG